MNFLRAEPMRRHDLMHLHGNPKGSGAKILAAGQPCKIGECNQNNSARSPDGANGSRECAPVGSIRATRDVAYRFALTCSAELWAASASLAEIAAVSAGLPQLGASLPLPQARG